MSVFTPVLSMDLIFRIIGLLTRFLNLFIWLDLLTEIGWALVVSKLSPGLLGYTTANLAFSSCLIFMFNNIFSSLGGFLRIITFNLRSWRASCNHWVLLFFISSGRWLNPFIWSIITAAHFTHLRRYMLVAVWGHHCHRLVHRCGPLPGFTMLRLFSTCRLGRLIYWLMLLLIDWIRVAVETLVGRHLASSERGLRRMIRTHWVGAVHSMGHHHLPEWRSIHVWTWHHKLWHGVVGTLVRLLVISVLIEINRSRHRFFSIQLFLSLARSAIRYWRFMSRLVISLLATMFSALTLIARLCSSATTADMSSGRLKRLLTMGSLSFELLSSPFDLNLLHILFHLFVSSTAWKSRVHSLLLCLLKVRSWHFWLQSEDRLIHCLAFPFPFHCRHQARLIDRLWLSFLSTGLATLLASSNLVRWGRLMFLLTRLSLLKLRSVVWSWNCIFVFYGHTDHLLSILALVMSIRSECHVRMAHHLTRLVDKRLPSLILSSNTTHHLLLIVASFILSLSWGVVNGKLFDLGGRIQTG